MKKFLSILIFIAWSNYISSQVAFCPTGALWNYEYGSTIFNHTSRMNQQIVYTGDSIAGNDTIKFLSHYKFYLYCTPYIPSMKRTLIKQKGDTIFFRNSFTQNTWQILYNFACQSGQSWTTQVVLTKNNQVTTFTYNVDSIKYVTINGFSLRRLYVNGLQNNGYITERFGSSVFLFNFPNNTTSCDEVGLTGFLCYTDNAFGTKQFGPKPCDYSNPSGFSELTENTIKVYPNPIKDKLQLEIDTVISEADLIIYNALGQTVCKNEITGKAKEIDISELSNGCYFLQLKTDSGIMKAKFIKSE